MHGTQWEDKKATSLLMASYRFHSQHKQLIIIIIIFSRLIAFFIANSSTDADDTKPIGGRSDRTEHHIGMYIGGVS